MTNLNIEAETSTELHLLPFAILDDELAALRRFDECVRDGEGYDVAKAMMQRLAEIGVVRRVSGSIYEHTNFGLSVLNGDFAAPATEQAKAEQPRLLDGPELNPVARLYRQGRYRRASVLDGVGEPLVLLSDAASWRQAATLRQAMIEQLTVERDGWMALAKDTIQKLADATGKMGSMVIEKLGGAAAQASPAKPDLSGLTASDRETVLGLIAWLGGAAQGDRPNTSRGDAAAALQRLLAAITKEPDHG